jgi:uncharacterized cupredoxin-like copper-binding protein
MKTFSAKAISEFMQTGRWLANCGVVARKVAPSLVVAVISSLSIPALFVSGLFISAVFLPKVALAADPALTTAIEVKVQTGALPDKMFQFIPSTIEFKAGTLYKLVLNNPGPNRHSFSSKQFAASVKTLKVVTTAKGVARDGVGNVASAPDLQVIELPPETQVEWWLIPQKTAEFTDLHCTVPGHEETGMGGTIVVK